jgi:hypothetical protein
MTLFFVLLTSKQDICESKNQSGCLFFAVKRTKDKVVSSFRNSNYNKEKNKMTEHFEIKAATRQDIPLILTFIKELAEYEKLLDEVVATEAILQETLFGDHAHAEVIIGYLEQKPVSFALFFHNFSTFLGRPGIYLEDLFVRPAARGKGVAA